MKNWSEGNVVEIPVDKGFSYAVIVKEPLLAFFESAYEKRPDLSEILEKPITFKIWVMKRAIGKNGWSVIGNIPLPEEAMSEPEFYKYDIIAKSFSIYKNGNERPASKEDCLPLEKAAVWEKEHVESRLNELHAGVENIWVKSLSVENIAT